MAGDLGLTEDEWPGDLHVRRILKLIQENHHAEAADSVDTLYARLGSRIPWVAFRLAAILRGLLGDPARIAVAHDRGLSLARQHP
jgi:hypothetical protein